ncbi:flavin reductase family protein [Flavobacteriaceae bacterium 14752]|uniref:flavin reductase family protein n=1 Tax=Mesohalobacter salilacus TaxID=2491711 RepID=UPI000F63AA7D|nr:flavin reductase [Flavobacteriaceae bacterium 14752]
MMHLSHNSVKELPSRKRAQLINSIGGLKSANLIGSISKSGQTNLAIFNSVMHIGSHPALLGFILRPTTVERHTYENIFETNVFTINHIHPKMIAQAHQTSAKYEKSISEFEVVNLEKEFLDDFKAPFVKTSPIKIACEYQNEYKIQENACRLIIGKITDIYFDEGIQNLDGFVDLTKSESVGCIGTDAYFKATILNRFEYAEVGKELNSKS